MADTGFDKVARAMRERKRDVIPALEAATEEATRILWVTSKVFLKKDVYGRKPDKTESGKLKWRQTGNLRRNEKMKVDGVVGTISNNAKAKGGGTGYAHARHNLGLSRGDDRLIPPAPRKKRKTEREAPFRADAIKATKQKRARIYRDRVRRALDKSAVRG